MLAILAEVESLLPELLRDATHWNSVFVDYHRPFVERLWMQYGEHRIMLHRIYPCEGAEALFHPHPWPSAMRILHGSYEMQVGWGEDFIPPRRTMRLHLAPRSTYEMLDPDLWHYVAPSKTATITLMVTGKPWKREVHKSPHTLSPLSDDQALRLRMYFQHFYPKHH